MGGNILESSRRFQNVQEDYEEFFRNLLGKNLARSGHLWTNQDATEF
jgi:hypothetical protein